MQPVPVIVIFDIGKTNKKVFLFDQEYRIIFEETAQFPETKDEDKFPCEDLTLLTAWIFTVFQKLSELPQYNIAAVNFSAYGASFVHLGYDNKPVAPLYNYLKPYPEELKKQFYETYGGEELVSQETASPSLGNLNSGLLLYWIKHRRPELFQKIKYSLHLPQYLSNLITGISCSDITSIGSHTALWNFKENNYHRWVINEKIDSKLAPLHQCNEVIKVMIGNKELKVGTGLHDSSAALIPYLISFTDPFLLISTGTWCISLNPFNATALTVQELKQDCLSYLTFRGKPVKASRLFAGNEHGEQVKRIAAKFNRSDNFYTAFRYDPAIVARLKTADSLTALKEYRGGTENSEFGNRDLTNFATANEAYHQLMLDIMKQQVESTRLIINNSPVKKIFVDGGFSKNEIYMNLLATNFEGTAVHAASVAQASSLGAALAIHSDWNEKALPPDLIDLKTIRSKT